MHGTTAMFSILWPWSDAIRFSRIVDRNKNTYTIHNENLFFVLYSTRLIIASTFPQFFGSQICRLVHTPHTHQKAATHKRMTIRSDFHIAAITLTVMLTKIFTAMPPIELPFFGQPLCAKFVVHGPTNIFIFKFIFFSSTFSFTFCARIVVRTAHQRINSLFSILFDFNFLQVDERNIVQYVYRVSGTLAQVLITKRSRWLNEWIELKARGNDALPYRNNRFLSTNLCPIYCG